MIGSQNWKNKDTSGIEDYKAIENKMDWTYCTPYKGFVSKFHESSKIIKQMKDEKIFNYEGTQLCANDNQDLKFVQATGENDFGIPLHMLGPENPILNYGEVMLYEDELADRGCSKSYARYRVMNDCWFVLLRQYIRLDKVAVRILDTRIFHKFGDKEIIRDFMWKESTWDSLRDQKGF